MRRIDVDAASDEQTAVLLLLQERLGLPDATCLEPPTRLDGGFSNDIFRVTLRGAAPELSGPLVVRLAHDDADVTRECLIQAHMSKGGVPAPPIVAWGTSSATSSRPFSISPLMAGTPFTESLRLRTAIPAFRRLPEQLASTMAALHGVAVGELVDQLAVHGWDRNRLDSVGVLEEVAAALEGVDAPSLRAGLNWLREEVPTFGSSVVCHADLHPLNLLFDGEQVVAVLDWELARVADPAFDVARTVMLVRMAPYPMSRVARRIVTPIARRLAGRFVVAYRDRRTLDERSLRWHEALHCFRILAILGAARPKNQRTQRMADVWMPVAPGLRRRFAELTSVTL